MYQNLDLNPATRPLLILEQTVRTAVREHNESPNPHPHSSLEFEIQIRCRCVYFLQSTSTDPN